MPPSYVNVGAWIGDGTMVDSHVLVGSCAQIGARVHLAAGVTIGGVLEPPGARPVIVEDEAFVGAGSALLEGVLVGRGAVIGAGRDADRRRRACTTSSAARSSQGRRMRRSSSRRVRSSSPGHARCTDSSRRSTACRRRSRCWSRTAMPGRPPGSPSKGPCDDDRPRRSGHRARRPPARNEILRAERLAGLEPDDLASRFGTPLYVYDLDVDRPPGRSAAGRPAAGRRARLRRQGEPGTGRRRPSRPARVLAPTSRPAASSPRRPGPASTPDGS